ncbi:hypothetical protein D3C84_980480 [compost metagenome]
MIVREDHRGCVDAQCLLHHFARIHRSLVDGAAEQLHVFKQPMLAVEEQRREHLVLETDQLGAQVVLDQLRRGEQCPALIFLINRLARHAQDLIHRRRQVAPLRVTH